MASLFSSGGLIPARSRGFAGPGLRPGVDEQRIRSLMLGGLHSVVLATSQVLAVEPASPDAAYDAGQSRSP